MNNLTQQLNDTKTQIRKLEDSIKELTKTQKELEDEIALSKKEADKKRKNLVSWSYNPDFVLDYPEPEEVEVKGLDLNDIINNLKKGILNNYDLAFLLGKYIENSAEYNKENPENSKIIFQKAGLLLLDIEIFFKTLTETYPKLSLEIFKRELDRGGENYFEIFKNKDLVDLFCAIQEDSKEKLKPLEPKIQKSSFVETEMKKENVPSFEDLVSALFD